ncbi:MAG: hypothetical protein Q8P24_09615 [Desulfobacterales bacterium]|nr:hypothetical protein [Desulfobacterales bacterium]
MGKLQLVLAIPENERSQALIDGTVQPAGIDLTVIHKFDEVADRHWGMLEGKFDAGEMSTSALIQTRVTGKGEPQLALPVFFIRGLRYRNIIVNKASGMTNPAQLAGKKIGLTRNSATTIILVRGMLEEEFGVPMEDVHWVAAEPEHLPGKRKVKVEFLNKKRDAILEMLSAGELDAAVFPSNDDYYSIFGGGGLDKKIAKYGNLRSIMEDPEDILEHYRRSGVHHIIHTITVKESVLQEHPGVVPSLLQAFREARKLAFDYAATPERKRQLEEEVRVLGRDPYDCRLGEEDIRSLEALMRYLVQQGFIEKQLPVRSLFAPGSLDS